jgi:hypothetical protein
MKNLRKIAVGIIVGVLVIVGILANSPAPILTQTEQKCKEWFSDIQSKKVLIDQSREKIIQDKFQIETESVPFQIYISRFAAVQQEINDLNKNVTSLNAEAYRYNLECTTR